MNKIDEAKQVLYDLGLPLAQQNRISALTLLALCNLSPDDSWSQASRNSLTLSNGIMRFVKNIYNVNYKQNTRESFRKNALNPFLEFRLIDLNPDNPDLPAQSSKTHYAIKESVLELIKSFNSSEWPRSAEKFKRIQFEENQEETALLRTIEVRNFKSIDNLDIQLGRFNVFIGANGAGKSNIIEALAMIGASKGNDLDIDGLISRGVRVAKPQLTLSSFFGKPSKKEIVINLEFEDNDHSTIVKSNFVSSNQNDIYSKWIDTEVEENSPSKIIDFVDQVYKSNPEISKSEILEKFSNRFLNQGNIINNKYLEILADFTIYNLNTQALRGLSVDSRRVPLGINGEGLDVLISSFNNFENSKLRKFKSFFKWMDDISVDKNDNLKHSGYKLGKSNSILYFQDKFMQKKNNIFSAENANEGILHVIFYLALFISNKTPRLFAIDNIETALNPKLCRFLIKELVSLSKERGKQVLVTTHNPAVLDGLNLFDESQRLFEVFRTDDGVTRVRRIKFKKESEQKKFKLSEMWMEGLLGAIPQDF